MLLMEEQRVVKTMRNNKELLWKQEEVKGLGAKCTVFEEGRGTVRDETRS